MFHICFIYFHLAFRSTTTTYINNLTMQYACGTNQGIKPSTYRAYALNRASSPQLHMNDCTFNRASSPQLIYMNDYTFNRASSPQLI